MMGLTNLICVKTYHSYEIMRGGNAMPLYVKNIKLLLKCDYVLVINSPIIPFTGIV